MNPTINIEALYSQHLSQLFNNFIYKIHENRPDVDIEWLQKQLTSSSVNSSQKNEKKQKEKTINTNLTCIALLQSGARKNQLCGRKVSNENGNFCSIHAKQNRAIQGSANADITNIIFKKNKYGNFEFVQTGLVLKSDKEKIVIGKQVKSDIIDLSEEDIALCKRKHFRYVENYSKTQKEVESED